ncbi:MAG: hypothetical protein IJ662_04835 [Clostridia bacterium]|nr:hypothetical protein [Clostridia bacterium]
MRKWMAGWIALMILTLTFVCLGEEELSFAPLTGGWTPAEDSAVADEALRVFEEGLAGLVGVEYTPVAYLGSQVVAGVNHCYLARARAVSPQAQPYYALVYLYEDLFGHVSVLDIETLDFGALCQYGAEE